MDKTNSYSYFAIKGDFDPDIVTSMLNINPTKSWKMGDLRKDGSEHTFSLWETGRCGILTIDVEDQCLHTIKELRNKVDILLDIKKKFDLDFVLEIVPHIYEGNSPSIGFHKEIIEFCYLTDTYIDVDIYIYPFNDED